MRRAGGGYTIVEVLIVLAISAAIFFIALGMFTGKNNSAQFTQAIQDLASKIQGYSNQVTSGVAPDLGTYICNVTGNGSINFSSGGPGDSSACVFLGKALLVTQPTSISAYSVVGTKNRFFNGADTLDPAQNFTQSNPTTARQGSNNLFLDQYTLNNGLRITSSKIAGRISNYGIVGIYLDVGGTSASDTANSSGLLTKAYPYTGGPANVQNCIQGGMGLYGDCRPANGSLVANFSLWQLCVQNGSGGDKALLNVSATASGLTSRINYQSC
jgi:type II secretory pathway pseudopilin PulG